LFHPNEYPVIYRHLNIPIKCHAVLMGKGIQRLNVTNATERVAVF